MIIYSRKKKKPSVPVENTVITIVNNEVKSLDNEVIQKPKKKKNIPTPVAVEEPIVVEEKTTEDEDLSKWLEEHTED